MTNLSERVEGASGAEISMRRFGPAYEKPCARPDVVICAAYKCQIANECRFAQSQKDST